MESKGQVSKTSGCSCGSDKNCCSQKVESPSSIDAGFVPGELATSAGHAVQVSTLLTSKDILGSWKARWGINRMDYKIDPGLYCVGNPVNTSPVFVTANYKMSFDSLRKELAGLDAWILVLDTKGINVWCAAGKGTFGTKELIERIIQTGLSKLVSSRTVILPQLGAPGIAAHEVQKSTGFKVVYGPVRAEDIKAFLSAGMKATGEMRTVKFTFIDRLVLTPIEIVSAIKPSIILFGILFILNSIGFGQFGFTDLYAYIGAVLAGCFIAPVLLPWIPGRSFAFKGWLVGLLWVASVIAINDLSLRTLSYMLVLPAVSAYGALNFTGCSTYTSPTGVNREMKTAIPLMIISAGLGIVLLLADSIIKIFN